MSLLSLGVVAACVFLVCSWFLIPRLTKKITSDRSESSIGYSASLAFLGVVRSLSLVFMLTTIALGAILLAFSSEGTVEASKLEQAIQQAQMLKEKLSWFSVFWSVVTCVLMGLGLTFHSRRRGRMRFAKALEMKREQEFNRLQQDFGTEHWEELPPNDLMRQVDSKLEKLDEIANEVVESHTEEEAAEIIASMQLHADELNEMRSAVDVQRRVDARLDPEAIELPKPRNIWQRFERFFFSEGLVASLGGGARLMYLALLVLLIPSMIGVCSGGLKQQFDDRLVQLQDLRVDYSVEKSRQDWERVRQGFLNESNEEQQLSAEEEEAIDNMAVEAEVRFARSLVRNSFDIPRSTARSLHAISLRQRLLDNASNVAASRIEISPNVADSPHLSNSEKRLISDLQAARNKPTTRFGKKVASDLKELSAKSPTVRRRIGKTIASFQKPAKSKTMVNVLTRNAAGFVLDGGDGEISRAIALRASSQSLGLVKYLANFGC